MKRVPGPKRRPQGISDATVEACGAVTEALEYVDRARGHLYSFHQFVGHADGLLGQACEKLRASGNGELAGRWASDLVIDRPGSCIAVSVAGTRSGN